MRDVPDGLSEGQSARERSRLVFIATAAVVAATFFLGFSVSGLSAVRRPVTVPATVVAQLEIQAFGGEVLHDSAVSTLLPSLAVRAIPGPISVTIEAPTTVRSVDDVPIKVLLRPSNSFALPTHLAVKLVGGGFDIQPSAEAQIDLREPAETVIVFVLTPKAAGKKSILLTITSEMPDQFARATALLRNLADDRDSVPNGAPIAPYQKQAVFQIDVKSTTAFGMTEDQLKVLNTASGIIGIPGLVLPIGTFAVNRMESRKKRRRSPTPHR
jgi:hypothetical protein